MRICINLHDMINCRLVVCGLSLRQTYLAKTALSEDLVEDEVVHVDAGEMGEARHRSWAGPLPQFAILSPI